MYLRLLVSVSCLGITTSFLQRGYHGHNIVVGRRLNVAQEADSDSFESIIERIKTAPQRISDSTLRIAENIQAAPKRISDSTQRLTDIILSTPDEISKNVEQVARNIQDVKDAVVNFPSNVTATVTATQTNILLQAEDFKNTIKALSPLPYINNALVATKNVINFVYELKDGKVNSGEVITPLLPSETVKTAEQKSARNPEEVYEEIKENFYAAIDSFNGFRRGVVETAERVQQLPDDISKTRESLALSAEIMQKDFAEKQQQAGDIGKAIWKVVTLEAAKETFERTGKYVTDTTTMLQTNPTAIFKKEPKEKKDSVALAPLYVPYVPRDTSTLGKIFHAVRATKSGLDVTFSVFQQASNGVMGLKERIDKSIAEQELYDRKYSKKQVVSSITSTPFVGDILGDLDSSEGVSSSSTKLKPTAQVAAVVQSKAAIQVAALKAIADAITNRVADVSTISELPPKDSIEFEKNSDSTPPIVVKTTTPIMKRSRPLY